MSESTTKFADIMPATLASLRAANATLLAELQLSQQNLVKALISNASLTKRLAAPLNRSQPRPTPTTANPEPVGADGKYPNCHYCWSCGYRSNHTSGRCLNKKPGHKPHAKAADTQGGSTLNKLA